MRRERNLEVKKASMLAIVINALQILLVFVIMLYMYITPGEDAMSGDYATTVTARNSDANDSVDFRITVKTETIWGLTGIGVIVLLAVVIIIVMRKYGRR